MYVCMYNSGDCRDGNGTLGRCVAGAINNYTTQLLTYGNKGSDSQCKQTHSSETTTTLLIYTAIFLPWLTFF